MLSKPRSHASSSPAAPTMTIPTRQKKKGISLVKGPVGLIGLALLAYGISALIFGGHGFVQHAPSGAVHGKAWLGLEVNGWSGLMFIAAGLLLLLAAPLHWSAKGMSLIVGLALGAAALIALVKGHGTLGIFAANHRTELVWGAAAAVLIVVSLLPRVGGRARQRPAATQRAEREPRIAERESTEPQQRASNSLPTAEEPTTPLRRESTAANGAEANGADPNGAGFERAATNDAASTGAQTQSTATNGSDANRNHTHTSTHRSRFGHDARKARHHR
jgi:hypothetical protein